MARIKEFPDCCGAGLLSGLFHGGNYALFPATIPAEISDYIKKGVDGYGARVIDGLDRSVLIAITIPKQVKANEYLKKQGALAVATFNNVRTGIVNTIWVLPLLKTAAVTLPTPEPKRKPSAPKQAAHN